MRPPIQPWMAGSAGVQGGEGQRAGCGGQQGRLRLRDVRVVFPELDLDRRADVELDCASALDGGTLDAAKMVLCPGFIDLHTHLRHPGQAQKEDPRHAAMAALGGGYTTLVAMANTRPVIDRPEIISRVIAELVEQAAPVRVFQVAALTQGLEGTRLTDLEALIEAGAAALSDDGRCSASTELVEMAMVRLARRGITLLEHSQLDHLAGRGVLAEGEVAVRLGLLGIPQLAEVEVVERDLELSERTGCRVHLQHLSTAAAVALVRSAKARGLAVTAEVNPHHLLLTEAAAIEAGTLAKVNPPLRSEADRLALVAGLSDGTIDAVATDHAPHELASKQTDWDGASFGISGLETAAAILTTLVDRGELTLRRAIESLTCGPASVLAYLPLKRAGDMTLLEPGAPWKVDRADFASLGRNTPLHGSSLVGRVQATWVAGEMAFSRAGLKVV